jgi:hypothetical protein
VAELAYAKDLKNLSFLRETLGMEVVKFGETFKMVIPSEAHRNV